MQTGFRGNHRRAAVLLRFVNTGQQPLVLAYDPNARLLTDDRGIRWEDDNLTLGLGLIAAPRLDPRFTLAPGRYADALLHLFWPGTPGKLFGLEYDLKVTLRQLGRVGENRWQPTTSHVIQFARLEDGMTVPVQGQQAVADDACAGRPDCSAADGLVTEVTRLSTSARRACNTTSTGCAMRSEARTYPVIDSEPFFEGLRQDPRLLAAIRAEA